MVRDFVADTQYNGIQLVKRDDDDDDNAAAATAADFFCLIFVAFLLMLFDLVEHFRITGVLLLRTDDCHWSASFKHLTFRSNRLVRLNVSQR